jgi:hypothetical protein
MRRRVVIGIAVLAAGVALGVSRGDHGTVAAFASRLDDHCASVEHRRVEPSLPGAVSDDELECTMLSGFVDVVTFDSAGARDRAGAACVIGTREAVFERLLAPGMHERFRGWCRELGGRLAGARAPASRSS